MLCFVVENQAKGAVTRFSGKLVRCLAYDAPPYSAVGASGKLGAVQIKQQLRAHPGGYMAPYNYARLLKTLNGLMPYE